MICYPSLFADDLWYGPELQNSYGAQIEIAFPTDFSFNMAMWYIFIIQILIGAALKQLLKPPHYSTSSMCIGVMKCSFRLAAEVVTLHVFCHVQDAWTGGCSNISDGTR